MALKKLIKNAFEDLSELGRSTARQAAKSVVDTLSPGALIEHVQQKDHSHQLSQERGKPGKNSTPFDLKKLDKAYGGEEEAKKVAARNQLFQFIQAEQNRRTRQVQYEQSEQSRQSAIAEREERERQLYLKAHSQPADSAGKQKIRLGQARRKAKMPETTEYKPASGKQ